MKGNLKKIGLIILLALCTVAEGATAFWLFHASKSMLVLALFTHLLLCLFYLGLLYFYQKKDEVVNYNFMLIAGAVSLIIPVYGMTGLTIIFFAIGNNTENEQDYFEFDDSKLSSKLDEILTQLDEDIIGFIRSEQNIDALKDIFLSGDQQLEETAIQKLNQLGTKAAVTILQTVVEQSKTDVKILAASALTAIEEKTVEKIESLQSSLAAEPENPQGLLELAQAFDLYCHLGVLDSSLITYYQNLGIEYFRKYCQLAPQDNRARTELGRLLLKSQRFEEAKSLFRELVEEYADDFNAKIWLAETYYADGEYHLLRQTCREIEATGDVPEICADTVSWWTSDIFAEEAELETNTGAAHDES